MAYGEGLRRNRCGIWCWRWVVPADVRRAFPFREVSRSLHTGSKREALARSLPLRAVAAHLLGQARAGMTLDEESLRALLAETRARQALRELADRQEQLFLEANDARIAALQALREERERHTHELSRVVAHAAASVAANVGAGQGSPRRPAPLLSACFDLFVSERCAQESWTPKTTERWQFTFRCLLQALGDCAVDHVTRDDVTRFFEQLKRLPSNAQKKPALKGKTFLELIEVEGHDAISKQTVNDHMTRISGFFKWAMTEGGFIAKNPATRITIKGVRNRKRLPFTEEELICLFSHENFTTRTFLHPHYYWLMPLGIYTGMRLNVSVRASPSLDGRAFSQTSRTCLSAP